MLSLPPSSGDTAAFFRPTEPICRDVLREYEQSEAGQRFAARLRALNLSLKEPNPEATMGPGAQDASPYDPPHEHRRGNGLLVDNSDWDRKCRTAGFFDLRRRNMRQP